MSKLPPEALTRLRRTKASGVELLDSRGLRAEPEEVAIQIEAHRWFWRPSQPRILLVAESHVFTSNEDLAIKIDDTTLKSIGRSGVTPPPDSFVRLVYCLGYGEPDLLMNPPPRHRNPGTANYWKIFQKVAGRSRNTLGDKPDWHPCSMNSRQGSHWLRESGRMPGGTLAGFGSASPFEPGGTLAGFETASRRCRPTVSRWRPSSRAIRRLDQPCADKVNIECCKLTLSSFIALKSSLRCPIRNASLKVAYFEVPIPGRFSLSADTCELFETLALNFSIAIKCLLEE